MDSIGEQIKKARINQEMTQSALAKAIGCTNNTISRWERGLNVPLKRDKERLAEVLGIVFDDIEKQTLKDEKIKKLESELLMSRRSNKRLIVVIFAIVVLALIFAVWLIITIHGVDPDAPDGPTTIIYYDVKEGETIK